MQSPDKNRRRAFKRLLAVLVALAVAGCGGAAASSTHPANTTALTVAGCKALSAWENGNAPVSATNSILAGISKKTAGTKFSSDLKTWATDTYPATMAESYKVDADCTAVGVPNPIGDSNTTSTPTPSPATQAPSLMDNWCGGNGYTDYQTVESDNSQISTDAGNDNLTALEADGTKLITDATAAGTNLPPAPWTNAQRIQYGLYMGYLLEEGGQLAQGNINGADSDANDAKAHFDQIESRLSSLCGGTL